MEQVDVGKTGSVFIYSEEMGWFDFGPDHPFKPERATKTFDLCTRYGVLNYPWMKILEPEPLNPNLLKLFHGSKYLSLLEDASRGKVSLEMLERGLGTSDNPVIPRIYEWSLMAAGGTYMAMNSIMSGDALVGFNPLGGFHHAMPDNAEGFCYINDIVTSILLSFKTKEDQRIVYLDLDAHHGNGVQEAFYDDPRVLFISLHETGRELYPWSGFETETGTGDGRGYTVNVPLEPGTDDEIYSYVCEELVYPLIKSFSPDMIFALLGADTLVSDPLTHMKLTNNGYQNALKGVIELCPKILGMGGGGYDLYRTARCWTLAWSILNRVVPKDEFAGLVGGMMFGPEMEVGSLYDHPYRSKGEIKERAFNEARRVVEFIKNEIFPVYNL